MYKCKRCAGEIPPARYALGYRLCLRCGEAASRQCVRTVVPMHKSNYVMLTRKEDLVGINTKGGCT
jgi:hypothetical protein